MQEKEEKRGKIWTKQKRAGKVVDFNPDSQ